MLRGSKAFALVRPLLVLGERLRLNRPLRGPAQHIETSSPSHVPVALPIQQVMGLWADFATLTQESGLPLRAATLFKLEDLGLAGFCALTALNGRSALDLMINQCGLLTTSGRWHSRLRQDGRVQVVWSREGERCLGHRLANESGMAQFVAGLRQVLGPDFHPARVTFRHAAPPRIVEHRTYFACPVAFEQAEDSFEFAGRVLDRAPPLANPALFAYLLEQAQKQLYVSDACTVVALREQLRRELLLQEPDLRATRAARALGCSERGLRRKLQDEGTNFRAVLSDVRREVARLRVGQSQDSVTQIALSMGFSDSSAFSHAMRRWFGKSARDIRRTGVG